MTDLPAAVAEYMAREKEANAAMRGADHMRIMDAVAKEYGYDVDVLADAVIRRSVLGAN